MKTFQTQEHKDTYSAKLTRYRDALISEIAETEKLLKEKKEDLEHINKRLREVDSSPVAE